MERDRQNVFYLWTIFCLFIPLAPNNPENQNFEKMKKKKKKKKTPGDAIRKSGDIIILHRKIKIKKN